MAIFGFILMVCYIPGVTGFALPSGWLLLSATLPWILRQDLIKCLNPFLLWAIVGLLWTPVWQQGVYDLVKLAILSAVFVMGQNLNDVRPLYTGLAIGLLLSTVVALTQWFGLHPVETIYLTPSGLFFNPNVLGEIAALIVVACWFSDLRWWVIASLPPVFLSQSRTAILTLGVVGVIWLWRRYSTVVPILLLLAGLMIPLSLIDKPLGHLTYRIAVWQNTIDGFTALGRGPGSFMITYPVFATRTDTMTSREEDAHNDFLQMAYQYGLPGVALLLPLVALGLFGPLGPDRYLFIAFCIIAFFNFPLELPHEAFLGVLALGRLCGRRLSLRNLWLACRWPLGGRMAIPQSRLRPDGLGYLPLEPIHSDEGGLFRHGVHRPF